MGANPYLEDFDDDDIFAPKAPRSGESGLQHKFDGSICHCGVKHQMGLPANVPPEILEQLSAFLDKLPIKAIEVIVTAENSLALKLFNEFLEYADELDKANKNGPLLRALAEAAERTEAVPLAPYLQLYESELYIVSTHVLLKTLGQLRAEIEKEDTERFDDDKKNSLFEVMDTIVSTSQERLELAIKRYEKAALAAGEPIDQSLIDTGSYSDGASYFATRIIQLPLTDLTRFNKKDDKEDEN